MFKDRICLIKKAIKSNIFILKYKFELKLPHNLRIFHAFLPTIRGLSLFILISIISINIYYDKYFNELNRNKALNQVLIDPYESEYHVRLAKEYLEVNSDFAEKEYLLADELFNEMNQSSGVLGVQTSPALTWSQIKFQQENHMDNIKYWKKIIEKFPDYRYGYLAVASYYFEIGDKENSLLYLNKLFSLNPADSQGLELKEKMEVKQNI